MNYWLKNWDFECPTLFGIEKGELQQVCNNWPIAFDNSSVATGLAISGSFRELLWGASSLPDLQILELLNMSKDEVEKFYEHISEYVKAMTAE